MREFIESGEKGVVKAIGGEVTIYIEASDEEIKGELSLWRPIFYKEVIQPEDIKTLKEEFIILKRKVKSE